MGRMRRFAKRVICWGFVCDILTYTTEGIVALVTLGVVIWAGEFEDVAELTVVVFSIFLLLGFVWWVARDARKVAKRLRQEKRERKTKGNEEMSEPTFLPKNPPWMG